MNKNCILAEDLLARRHGEGDNAISKDGLQPLANRAQTSSVSKAETEALKDQLKVACQIAEATKSEKESLEGEVVQYKQLVSKYEVDLQGLSEAYNNLEQENYQYEKEIGDLRKLLQGKGVLPWAADHEVSEKTQKDSDCEMDDLLACLGQEESKVEKLRARLEELGEDVDTLLEGIGENEGDDEDEDKDIE